MMQPKTYHNTTEIMPPLTTQPLAENKQLDAIRSDLLINVNPPERIASAAAGIALMAYGLSRRSLPGVFITLGGAALLLRGGTGHCMLYQQLGINSRRLNNDTGVPGNKGTKLIRTIVVNRPPDEVYRYWRDLRNLAEFMEHVEEIEEIDQLHSRWVVKGPAGTRLQWHATILTEREGELISWESLPGAEVENAGSVRFDPVRGGTATQVRVTLQYHPPAGVLGATVAKLLGEAPEQQLASDLERFKNILEARVPADSNGKR
jgi:uncharacterized membrane protein